MISSELDFGSFLSYQLTHITFTIAAEGYPIAPIQQYLTSPASSRCYWNPTSQLSVTKSTPVFKLIAQILISVLKLNQCSLTIIQL